MLQGTLVGWHVAVCAYGAYAPTWGCSVAVTVYAPESIVSACPSATRRLLEAAPRNATVSSTGVARDAVCGTARRSNASRSLSCMVDGDRLLIGCRRHRRTSRRIENFYTYEGKIRNVQRTR